MNMAKNLAVENDPEEFRRSMEIAGFLRPNAPLTTDQVVEHLAVFYATIRKNEPRHHDPATTPRPWCAGSSTCAARSPSTSRIPRSYVVLQRINLGLFAVLGELTATANWRAIAEEIWPFVQGPPSTPMGEAEADWRRSRRHTSQLAGLTETGAQPN